jgi:Flp pilus assembly protein TadD
VAVGAGGLAVLALVAVLGFPYLSAREQSIASDLRQRNPQAALSALRKAAQLNPLSAAPGRLGGTIALQAGLYLQAEKEFRQAIAREPGGWFSWFGDGLAASVLGDTARARHDFDVAVSIQRPQPAVRTALARVNSLHPLTPAEALSMLVLTK